MAFPSVLTSAGSLTAAICALAVAITLSWRGKSLVVVALSSSAVVYLVNLVLTLF